MRRDRVLHVSEGWFRLLLWLYPPDFRDEMGDSLVQTYLDRCRSGSIARVWFAALRESLRHGPAERLRPAASWRRSGNWLFYCDHYPFTFGFQISAVFKQ